MENLSESTAGIIKLIRNIKSIIGENDCNKLMQLILMVTDGDNIINLHKKPDELSRNLVQNVYPTLLPKLNIDNDDDDDDDGKTILPIKAWNKILSSNVCSREGIRNLCVNLEIDSNFIDDMVPIGRKNGKTEFSNVLYHALSLYSEKYNVVNPKDILQAIIDVLGSSDGRLKNDLLDF